MSTTRASIVLSSEQVFDRHGFAATGMDRLTQEAGVSSRTLYKHLGSKDGLVAAVLSARAERFFAAFDVRGVDALFSTLAAWTASEGARGCLFLRALAETGGDVSGVVTAVADYRDRLVALVRRAVVDDLGRVDEPLAEQVLVLFEGAVSAASYRGAGAVVAARAAATTLVRLAG